ncbi:MAG: YbaB/EbfC family nucleoid-associated protein, partial [Planctomycetota bacterium]
MFDNLKNLAGLPGMLSKAKEMQERMGGMHEKLAETLADLRIDADAGGGMVTATCNGKMELVNLKIDPARLRWHYQGQGEP